MNKNARVLGMGIYWHSRTRAYCFLLIFINPPSLGQGGNMGNNVLLGYLQTIVAKFLQYSFKPNIINISILILSLNHLSDYYHCRTY